MVCEVRRVGPGSCGRSIAKTQGGTKLGALWASEGTVVVTAAPSGSFFVFDCSLRACVVKSESSLL